MNQSTLARLEDPSHQFLDGVAINCVGVDVSFQFAGVCALAKHEGGREK